MGGDVLKRVSDALDNRFSELDSNKDSRLDRGELEGLDGLIGWDSNKDGIITQNEYREGVAKLVQNLAPKIDQLFAEYRFVGNQDDDSISSAILILYPLVEIGKLDSEGLFDKFRETASLFLIQGFALQDILELVSLDITPSDVNRLTTQISKMKHQNYKSNTKVRQFIRDMIQTYPEHAHAILKSNEVPRFIRTLASRGKKPDEILALLKSLPEIAYSDHLDKALGVAMSWWIKGDIPTENITELICCTSALIEGLHEIGIQDIDGFISKLLPKLLKYGNGQIDLAKIRIPISTIKDAAWILALPDITYNLQELTILIGIFAGSSFTVMQKVYNIIQKNCPYLSIKRCIVLAGNFSIRNSTSDLDDVDNMMDELEEVIRYITSLNLSSEVEYETLHAIISSREIWKIRGGVHEFIDWLKRYTAKRNFTDEEAKKIVEMLDTAPSSAKHLMFLNRNLLSYIIDRLNRTTKGGNSETDNVKIPDDIYPILNDASLKAMDPSVISRWIDEFGTRGVIEMLLYAKKSGINLEDAIKDCRKLMGYGIRYFGRYSRAVLKSMERYDPSKKVVVFVVTIDDWNGAFYSLDIPPSIAERYNIRIIETGDERKLYKGLGNLPNTPKERQIEYLFICGHGEPSKTHLSSKRGERYVIDPGDEEDWKTYVLPHLAEGAKIFFASCSTGRKLARAVSRWAKELEKDIEIRAPMHPTSSYITQGSEGKEINIVYPRKGVFVEKTKPNK